VQHESLALSVWKGEQRVVPGFPGEADGGRLPGARHISRRL
jgi:hypothetical protein